MKPIIVIYHKADFDGIFCREIAKKFFGDKADYIGWDYGDPLPSLSPDGHELYMLDISVEGLMDYPGLTWIDHHKSAMEKFNPSTRGYRIDGVAACRLAWQWFFRDIPGNIAGGSMPTKQDFVDRKVIEPMAVRLAGEYDIWDKRDDRAELFQHGLRSRDLENDWSLLLSPGRPPTAEEKSAFEGIGLEIGVESDGNTVPGVVAGLLASGRVLQYAKTKENESIAKHLAFTFQWEGLTFCAINAARYNSHLFTAGIKPEHDALFGFNFDGTQWRVSLYHAPGKEQHDLSQIAVKYGGGGHRGACGFKTDKLPFIRPSFKELSIIDAAVEVATFSKTHEWPQNHSPEFFDFANKLDRLATAINAFYPSFNSNIANR